MTQLINLSKTSVELDEILNFLKINIQFKEVYQRILQQKIIDQSAQERGLTVTSEEIQAEADRHREKRLEKASDTMAWLLEEMITVDQWEEGIRERLLAQKLAQSLFDKEVEKFFIQKRLDFEQILLYQIIVSCEKLAQELFYQIEEKEISFYEAAHLYDIDGKRRQRCGCEGMLYRWSLKPDIAAIVFSANPKEVLGPINTAQGYHLLMIEEFTPAELSLERYQDILDRLFKEWLASELNHWLHSKI